MKLLLIVVSLLVSSVCMANRESGGHYGASAVYIDFRSLGAGIDKAGLNAFEELYTAAKGRGEVRDETLVLTGREGELRYCVHFETPNQRYNFVSAMAFPILYDARKTGAQRTAVFVGFDCHHFEEATEQDLTRY